MRVWISVVSVPLGGFLADRTGRPGSIVVASAIVTAVLMVLLPRSGAVVALVIALGLISGLPAGRGFRVLRAGASGAAEIAAILASQEDRLH